MAPIITIIGSLNMDLVTVTPRVPGGGETLTASSFHTGSGGKGANQAVAVVRQSRPNPHKTSITSSSSSEVPAAGEVAVKMIGAVGADEFGPRLVSSLQHDGIDVSGIRTITDERTGVAVILVEEKSGQNRILFSAGANFAVTPADFSAPESLGSPLPSLIVLQLEIPLDVVLKIIETARAAGVDVLLNPAPAVQLPDAALAGLKHLILNETEAAILAGESDPSAYESGDVEWQSVADKFLSKGVQNVVITLGSKGSYSSNELGKGLLVGVEPNVKVVDTTAAGDTFVGAYAVNAVRSGTSWNIEAAVRWATKASARTVEKAGAQSAIPWADEVLVSR